MPDLREVEPLSYNKRRRTFLFLLTLFVVSLPFLFLYATGYRFDFNDPNALVGTGGIYVAAERTGAQIYIDDELVRETRVFRTAFYAPNLEPRTHRVHVQKDGHHTWVKELPVTSHRVTEAQAFNMPLVPQIRVVSEWVTATGTQIVRTPLPYASTTNATFATTTKATSTLLRNPEYTALISVFISTGTPPVAEAQPLIRRVQEELAGTTTPQTEATSTRESGDVRLFRDSEQNVYAQWIGSFEQMPYYYCAKPFPRYSTSTLELVNSALLAEIEEPLAGEAGELVHPVQTPEADEPCDRRIRIVGNGEIKGYEFFPGSDDLVILELQNGIYVSEIDARAWQNLQPLLLGENLHVHVENGGIYVYDGTLIYQIMLEA